MSEQTLVSGRLQRLTLQVKAFIGKFTWKDFEPIEERLAVAQVAKSGLYLVAPGLMLLSLYATWILFPEQSGTDSTGLFHGTAAIVFMAWALLLASRLKVLELAFGGFDRLHVWHRWAGIASIVFLYLHTMSENEVELGTRPFGVAAEEAGLVMASPAQTALVTLVIISMLRVLPYRIWRFSHIGLFLPFVFSAWHALTAVRPNEFFEFSGLWLWGWSIIGVLAFGYRILVVDSGLFDRRVLVESVIRSEAGIQLNLSTKSQTRWKGAKPGRFVFLRVSGLWSEAHPFSIVRLDDRDDQITIMIRKAGDWTSNQLTLVRAGDLVRVSKSYGHLRLTAGAKQPVWIAGGSGVTPFLQNESYLRALSQRPKLIYFYRGEDAAFGLNYLRHLAANELLTLVEINTSKNARDKSALEQNLAAGSHVVVCGPRKLVVDTMRLARKQKAGSFAFEIYDYRSPFGPNLNPLLKNLLEFALPDKGVRKLNWLFDDAAKPEKVPSESPR
jgi:predicted ferric reductase